MRSEYILGKNTTAMLMYKLIETKMFDFGILSEVKIYF